MIDWGDIRHFERDEFVCKCGCGDERMQREFIEKLDELRERAGFPFVVTSGYRCPEHNAQVSSTGRNGPHTTGRAVDLALFGHKAFRVLQQSALGGWMTGIGLNQSGPHQARFIHLDDLEQQDGRFRPTVWTY